MRFSFPTLASLAAGVSLVNAIPTSAVATDLQSRASVEPCAAAAAEAVAWAKQYPKGTVRIKAETAIKCLRSVTLRKSEALQLVRSLKSYAQLHSSIDYLRSPPSGYLYEAVDVPKLLDAIETKLLSNKPYESEYDFQVDLMTAFTKAKDGHFIVSQQLRSAFTWVRASDISLVSLSKDGKELPQVYLTRDIIGKASNTLQASAVKSINGMDVESFLIAESNAQYGQDPDNNWNTQFWRIQDVEQNGSAGAFMIPTLYPGATTTIELRNGTKLVRENLAGVASDISLIKTADDMYKKFSVPKVDTKQFNFTKRWDSEEHFTLKPRQQTTSSSFYPKPIFVDRNEVVAGYYLDNSNVAVLTVHSFMPGNSPEVSDLLSFQQTVQNFLADAVKKGKTNLIIDLQGNGGGAIDLSTDLFTQMFPNVAPNSKDNMRASTGMRGIIRAASNAAQEADIKGGMYNAQVDRAMVPFAYQEVMTPEVKNFGRLDDFYGPKPLGNGFYTNFFQGNYTNDAPTQYGIPGIIVTGQGNRKGFKQHFKAENIIMFTDGFCASACTRFSEQMKQEGVQIIALGGRPQTGPMQAVGGTKGSQVFQEINLARMVELFNSKKLNTDMSLAKGTPFEDFTKFPILNTRAVRVNGRNQFRIGDETQTPLQFVYEAADCRILYTPEMAISPVPIWTRVASLAFQNRKNGVIDSPYCVQDSTKHPTSISGGLTKGSIGPQTPPANAKPKIKGFLVNGKDLVSGLASGAIDDNSGVDAAAVTNEGDNNGLAPEVVDAVQTVAEVCDSYGGDEWFVKLMCTAFKKQVGA